MKTTQHILKAFVYLFCILSVQTGFTQNVGISSSNGFVPDASAGLDVSYANKGLLMPRVALTATNAAGPITSPAISLLVYNTATAGTSPNNVVPGYYYWNGLAWTALSTGTQTANSAWATTGNAGTTAGTNFIGTTDAKNFIVKTNNTQIADFTSNGNVTIGMDSLDATNPEKLLVHTGTTNSVNAFVAKGRINNYFQMNVKNLSTGAAATSDIVATSDNGTETSNYVDLGINGSGYTGSAIQTGKANDGYLISAGNDFYLVNSTPNKSLLFLTGGTGVAQERMRILANGKVGMGIQDPTNEFVVKDTMEIRRTSSSTLSQLLFSNTAGTGDLRIAGDGGDLFWQGGGGRALQMGSYWTTILGGDRQTSGYPAYVSAVGGTGVLVQSQRDASVPLAVQSFSGTQSANLTEWRASSGTVLSVMTKDGNLGIGTIAPTQKLDVNGSINAATSVISQGSVFVDAAITNTGALSPGLILGGISSGESISSKRTTGTNQYGIDFYTAGANRMTIANSGNIGIGNNTPTEKLDVTGNLKFSGALMPNNNAGTAGYFLQSAGSGTPPVWVSPAASSAWSTIGNTGTTAGTNFIGTTDAVDFVIKTNNTERARITNAGNVGIGTNTPVSTLDVNGSVGYPILVASTSTLTLDTSNYTVIIPSTLVTTITLPTASTSTKRKYVIVNQYPSATTISSYISFTGSAVTSIPGQTSITVQSDGTSWYRIQ